MSNKQRICAVLIWSTSAYTLGRGLLELVPAVPEWVAMGMGGLAALLLIIEAGRR